MPETETPHTLVKELELITSLGATCGRTRHDVLDAKDPSFE